MAKWVNATVLNSGLNYIQTTCTRMMLLKAYTAGDSYATVTANMVAEAVMAPADMPITGASGAPRVLTFAAKSAVASAGTGAAPDNHIAFTDGVGTVICVTDETSDQVVTSGNTVNFPALTYTSGQPT